MPEHGGDGDADEQGDGCHPAGLAEHIRRRLRLKEMRFIPFAWPAALLAWAALAAPSWGSSDESYIVVGLMAHRNIPWGGQGAAWGFGLELSYWDRERPVGYDAGIEFDTRKAVRLYAEAENGINNDGVRLAGLALGPVLEFGPEGTRLGIQGSAWANFIAGIDFRFRYPFGDRAVFAPGAYLKFPSRVSGGGGSWEMM